MNLYKIEKPFGNNIWVKPIEKEQVLVSDRRTLCEYGEVMGVGKDVQEVKVGDIIAFTIWGLNSIDIDEKTRYYIVQENPDFLLAQLSLSE